MSQSLNCGNCALYNNVPPFSMGFWGPDYQIVESGRVRFGVS